MRTSTMFTAWCLHLLLTWHGAALAQSSRSSETEILRNESIIEMVTFGFDEGIIIEKIRQAPNEFDTRLNALKKLKEAGVSDAVIKAMIGAQATKTEAKPSVEEAPDDPDDPASPHEPGIYWLKQTSQETRLIQLEPTIYAQGKSGGWIESQLTYGLAKVKSKAVVPRPKARVRIANAKPLFYFYFEQRSSGLSYTNSFITGASSPNEFVLVKMTEKRDGREVTIAEANAFSSSSGTRSEDTRDFDFEKLGPGIYRVTITSSLEPGEYCFFHSGGTGEKLFDFGIDRGTAQEPAGRHETVEEERVASTAEGTEILKAEIVEIKAPSLIIDLGVAGALSPGTSVQVGQMVRGQSKVRSLGLAEVVEESEGLAVIRMTDVKKMSALTIGETIVLKVPKYVVN